MVLIFPVDTLGESIVPTSAALMMDGKSSIDAEEGEQLTSLKITSIVEKLCGSSPQID